MNFDRQALDRYLTTEPFDNDWEGWVEQVYDNYTDDFFNNIGQFENSSLEAMWLERLYAREKSPEQAARVIERTHRLCKINNFPEPCHPSWGKK